MKALVGTFNQEKALVGAFSVIVQPVVEPMDRFAALHLINANEATGPNQRGGGRGNYVIARDGWFQSLTCH